MKRSRILMIAGIVLCLGAVYCASNYRSIFKSDLFEREGEEEEEKESGVAGQMQTFLWQRGWPDPHNLNDKYLAAWQQAQAMRNPDVLDGTGNTGAVGSNNRLEYGAWTSIGPSTGIGGRILSLAVHPTTTTTVFAGSASGGIWKTTNGGTSWAYVPTNQPVLSVPTIIISTQNPNRIYAGTGEVYRADTTEVGFNIWKGRGNYGIGILRSIDGGTTWTQCFYKSTSNLFGVQRLRFNPLRDSTIYAACTDGLYRSQDAGNTWSNIAVGKTYVSDVCISNADTNQIMIGVGNLNNGVKGIYKTTNGGNAAPTWNLLSAAPLPGAASFSGLIHFAYLNAATVYAGIGIDDAGTQNELFRTTNFGGAWTQLANSAYMDYQYWCTNAMAIDPARPDTIVLGGVSMMRYRSAGQTSGAIGGTVHSDIHDIKFDPSSTNTFYVACDGGVYKTTNGGGIFSQIDNGLAATQFYATFGVSALTPNLFLGGLQDNGVVKYSGGTWTTLGWIGGDGTACGVAPNSDANMVACRDARGIYHSTTAGWGSGSNTGQYWGAIGDSRTAFVAPIAYSKSSPTTLYCATDCLHKSTDGGTTWSGATLGAHPPYPATTPNNFISAMHKTGIALAVSATNANKVYVSVSNIAQFDNDVDQLYVTGNPDVLKTTTGGTPFASIQSNLPSRFVMDFAISPTFDDSVVVALGGYGTSHIWVTGNGGGTWVSRGTGLPDCPFNAVVMDKSDPKILYAGCDLGVYVSRDQGVTWYSFNGGFQDAVLISDLQITADNKIVAATHGKGAWISNLASTATLPANITEFTGVYMDTYNELKWNATQENNVSHYELERSIDGGAYQKVGDITSKNTLLSSYTFDDPVSSVYTRNTFYYRLKTVNKDGSHVYSNVVVIKISKSGTMLILGNPVTSGSSIQLTLDQPQKVTFKLFDIRGRLVSSSNFNASSGVNRYSFTMFGQLAAGHYVLEAITETDRYNKRFVVPK